MQAQHLYELLIDPSPGPVQIGAGNVFIALRALQALECTGYITRQQRTRAESDLDLSQADTSRRRCVLQLDDTGSVPIEHRLHLAVL